MTDLLMNADTHDLALPFARVDGADGVRQALDIRMQFFRAEWFLDVEAGVPYFQNIFAKKLSLGLGQIDSIFKDAILDTPGVLRLLTYSSQLAADRKLTVTFTVATVFGDLEVSWLDFLL